MNATLPDAARDALATRLRAEADVQVAALFGSAATGALRPGSDVDVYLRLARDARWPLSRELALATDLGALVGREIDLVVEDRARTSVLLRRDVARDGVLLFEREPGAWVDVKTDAIIAYTDLEPQLTLCAAGVRRALSRGAPGR